MAGKKSKKSPLPKFLLAIAVMLLALAVLTGTGAKSGLNTADSQFIDENIPEFSEIEEYVNIILSFIGNTGSGSPTAKTDTITIGSFNIQVFGQSKASDDRVMTTLAEIIRNFDIIAIQEIRDSSGTAAPLLLDYVNSDGSDYAISIGERLGRTSSKEQYAYIYNKNTVRPAGDPVTYPDSTESDLFHREPYIMPFEATDGDFRATCAVIHTDPDEAEEEIPELIHVMDYMKGILPGDDALILMGDLNADCSYFNENSDITLRSEEYHWLISNSEDTTTGNTVCTYDRIILNGGESYYTGDSGVFRFDTIYGLNQDESLKVSDHYPVSARFKISEKSSIPLISSLPSEDYAPCSEDACIPENSNKNENNSGVTESKIMITGINPVLEEVTIQNTGDEDKQISGWRLSDSSGDNSYIFPHYTITAGNSVTVTQDINITDRDTLIWHTDSEIWDDSGDCAHLYDINGNKISEFCIRI